MTDRVSIPALVELGVIVGVFLGPLAEGRSLEVDPKRHALAVWPRMLVAGFAMSPSVAVVEGLIPATVVAVLNLTVSAMMALWIALPVLASRPLDAEPRPTERGC